MPAQNNHLNSSILCHTIREDVFFVAAFERRCLNSVMLYPKTHFEALNSSYQSVATYHLKTNITPLTRFCLLRSSFSHFSLEISFWNFSISLENESERITPKPFITSVIILQGAQGLTQRRESPLLS